MTPVSPLQWHIYDVYMAELQKQEGQKQKQKEKESDKNKKKMMLIETPASHTVALHPIANLCL